MGKHYKADTTTPFWTAFFKNQRACKFVEETEGAQGSGVYMYRNLFNRPGETKPQDLVGDVKEKDKSVKMPTSRNLDARRRLSQSAQLRANLPLMVES